MTRALVDPRSVNRLAKLLAMCGSDYDGEVVIAARMADRLVREAGLCWADVITMPTPPTTRRPCSRTSDWKTMAGHCNSRPWLLTEQEREFIRSIINWRRDLTEKQKDWLCAIYSRTRGAGR